MTLGCTGSSSQQSSESDARDVTLPQKKSVAKLRSSSSGCGVVTVVKVEQRRRNSSAGDHDDNDDEDDDDGGDDDDTCHSDSTSDFDTAAGCSEVRLLHLTCAVANVLITGSPVWARGDPHLSLYFPTFYSY